MSNPRQEVHDKLIAAFARYQYNLDNPMHAHLISEQHLIRIYQTDKQFSSKVQNLTAGVMKIIEPYLRDE